MSQEIGLFDNFKAPTVVNEVYQPKVVIGGAKWNKISLKGSRFNYIPLTGDTIEGGKFGELNIVILGVPEMVDNRTPFHRTFYLATYGGDENVGPPDCYSEDGIAPIAGVPHPQSDKCATCEKGMKGSADGGRRACGFTLPVVAAPISKDGNFDVARAAVWRINAGSLIGENDEANGWFSFKEFSNRVEAELKKHKQANPDSTLSLSSLVVGCKFDTRGDENYKVVFQPKSFITDDMVTHMNTAPVIPIKEMLRYEASGDTSTTATEVETEEAAVEEAAEVVDPTPEAPKPVAKKKVSKKKVAKKAAPAPEPAPEPEPEPEEELEEADPAPETTTEDDFLASVEGELSDSDFQLG